MGVKRKLGAAAVALLGDCKIQNQAREGIKIKITILSQLRPGTTTLDVGEQAAMIRALEGVFPMSAPAHNVINGLRVLHPSVQWERCDPFLHGFGTLR